jgi:SRSO17 transposase
MTERIPESDYDQLQHFISHSPWNAMDVMDSMSEKLHKTLSSSTENTTPSNNLGLIIDESGWEKSGKKSVGVARQYIGQVGKVSNGQVGVFAGLTDGTQVGLVQGRLYLPKEWTDDKTRCDAAKIPLSEQIYRTKPELSVEILKTLPSSVTYDWVGGDDLYGNSFILRQYLKETEQAFVVDVSDDLGVYFKKPELYIPPKKDGRGRPPTAYVCEQKPIQLKKLIKEIKAEDWQIITHRNGTKGPMTRRACIIDIYVWKSIRGTQIESLQLLISTEQDGSEVKYSLCYDPKNKMSLSTALYRQMQRYWVERAFQNVKEQLGMNQYQVRSWTAWYHHIALSLMALHFLLQIQKEDKQEIPLLSLPDIKLIFAKKLLNKLNSDDGLALAIKVRHKKRKKDIERHFNKKSKVPK